MSRGSVSKQKQSSPSVKNDMDKYEVIKLLGEGSFGRVYKAKVIADSSFVALKVICKGRRSNKEIIGLRRECEIQRHLHHPNIIQMLDSFETPNEIVVVTEFAQKELNTVLGKEGYLTEERASPIIWDLVSALNYLHSHRVLHRDLKPQNILIDSKNRAKLCDFGFARNMSTGTHVLTSIKGTPLYMAPELIEEQPYDYKADLWSLGCIMYELLVGAPPFCTASILHLIRLIRHEQIRWPTLVSESCVSFLKGLLQKDPLKRINWEQILNHDFVKGHILICNDSTNMPLTRALSENTLQVQEQQRKERMTNKVKSSESKVSTQDLKNNNLSSSVRNDTFIEENHPIETEEWIVFLQKSMEEVIGGELTSLTQTYLTNIIVSPLRNTNTSPKVLVYVAKLLSLPFALRGISHETKEQIKKVFLEVKLVPNLIYSSKKIMKVLDSSNDETTYKNIADLTEEDFEALECVYMLITHLVHLDNEFLSQLCDSIAVLNVYAILKSFLLICKNRLQLVMDLLAILTHVLRVFPEHFELVDRIVLSEGKSVNFVELLRHNNPLMQERTCFFLLFLGKHLPTNKVEVFWNETVRETLEALMYDSIGSVRNAADRTVEELRCKHLPANKVEVFWNETVRETLEALMYDSIGSVRNADDRTVEELSDETTYKNIADLTEEDFEALECVYMLITHLVHLDNEFLSQLCDSIAVLNVYAILKSFLLICKSRLQLVMDLLAILTHVLRVFPEHFELVDRIVLNEGKSVNFVELLRHNNPLMQERTCFFLLFLGKHLPANKVEVFWNETVRETLEALMYDSIGSVRNAADRTKLANELELPQILLFSDLNNTPNNYNEELTPIDLNPTKKVALILTSSGTTGFPKCVQLTHLNLRTTMLYAMDPNFLDLNQNESTIAFLPYFYVFGCAVSLASILSGCKSIVMEKFIPDLFLANIQKHKVTKLFVVPPILQFLVKNPMVGKFDISSVVDILCGAAVVGKELEEMVQERFKVKSVRQVYGMTELCGAAAMIPKNFQKYGSSGKVVSCTQIKVCDVANGKTLAAQEIGEIRVKGDGTMKSYLKNEEETKKAFDEEGFLKTGDLGYYDEEGYFYIVDRLKEIIKYKGFQVSPAELENLLIQHPAVKDAAVVGLPDKRAGELPLAFVVKQDQNVTEKELIRFISENVSVQKHLYGGVRFIENIPKNSSEKILRLKLQELL
ncbi:hypothetical protein TcasGA2_TC034941 [Tribolium castaneum]|uniref:non-specific serine/threonine protein kinase n=1 Tax=Tribolium castaneum TaxID=7070 RepID=A0A139WA23_TRICA|nr:hypothetical protein TcasGA2_TC034941 [Tribolium castaneum]